MFLVVVVVSCVYWYVDGMCVCFLLEFSLIFDCYVYCFFFIKFDFIERFYLFILIV